jgi:hypothetical protein
MLPISGTPRTVGPPANFAAGFAADSATNDNKNTGSFDMAVCIDALSSYLDSPLAVDGLRGVGSIAANADIPTLTHLMFYGMPAEPQQYLMIHLIRNGQHLLIGNLKLPDGHDSLECLLRATVTAAHAARDWDGETQTASDADMLALRKIVDRTFEMPTHMPMPMHGQPLATLINPTDTLVQGVTNALRDYKRSLAMPGLDTPITAAAADAAARLAERRPHTTSPAVPLFPSASGARAESGSGSGATTSASTSAAENNPTSNRGMKRPHSDHADPISMVTPVAVPAITLSHPDKQDASPTPP